MGKIYDEEGRPIQKKIRVVKYSKWNPAPFSVKMKEFEKKVKSKCIIQTKSGIKVQSMGEQKIADFLYDNDIDFEYDKLLRFGNKSEGDFVFLARPDFLVSGTNIVIEYWGLKYGDRSKPAYDERTLDKIALYKQERLILIEVFGEELKIFKCELLKDRLVELGVTG